MTTARPFRPSTPAAVAAAAAVLLAAGLAGLLAVPSASYAAQSRNGVPQPSIAPVAWELDFGYRQPQRIVVDLPDRGSPVAYWYLVYTVTNNTGQERFFTPEFEMLTSEGQVAAGNRRIPREVFEAIDERTRSVALIPPGRMFDRLLVGGDQARTSVAIWEEPTLRMGTFDLFIAGLSGEIVPLAGVDGEPVVDADDNPILLRKTRQIRWQIRGDDVYPQRRARNLVRIFDQWIMR